jgi:hypothetical protein
MPGSRHHLRPALPRSRWSAARRLKSTSKTTLRCAPTSVPTVMARALTPAAPSQIFAPARCWGAMDGSTAARRKATAWNHSQTCAITAKLLLSAPGLCTSHRRTRRLEQCHAACGWNIVHGRCSWPPGVLFINLPLRPKSVALRRLPQPGEIVRASVREALADHCSTHWRAGDLVRSGTSRQG